MQGIRGLRHVIPAIALAADQQHQLRRGVAEQGAVIGNAANEMIVDHDGRDRRDEALSLIHI